MPMADHHPIFDDIHHGELGAVQQRVLTDPAVLEGRHGCTPLMYAICNHKPAIALWLVEHRGQHDVDTGDGRCTTALHHACIHGPLSVVQALVAAGADPSFKGLRGWTPLMHASYHGHADIVACLLGLPTAKATIDSISDDGSDTALSGASLQGHTSIVQLLLAADADPTFPAGYFSPINQATQHGRAAIVACLLQLLTVKASVNTLDQFGGTPLALASHFGHSSIVQLLLDAGADPLISAGDKSPLKRAISQGRTDVAALLRRAVAEPDRVRALVKVRALLDAPLVINKAVEDAHDLRLPVMEQQQSILAVTPAYLKSRVAWGKALPRVGGMTQEGNERVRATVAFVLGLDAGGVQYEGLSQDLYVELLGYLLPAWADKGPAGAAAAVEAEEKEEEEESGSPSGATRHAAVQQCVGLAEPWAWWERACVFVLVLAQVMGLVSRCW